MHFRMTYLTLSPCFDFQKRIWPLRIQLLKTGQSQMNKSKGSVFSIVLMMTLLNLAVGALAPLSANPVCQAPGSLSWTFQTLSTLTFDATSHFYSVDKGDTIQVFVKNGGDGTNNFKMFSYDTNFANQQIKQVTGSSATKFIFNALLNEFLILKDISTNIYYVTKYDESTSTSLSLVKLVYASELGSVITRFSAMESSDGTTLVVSMSSPSQGGIYKYTWPTTAATQISPIRVASLISGELSLVKGSYKLFLDGVQNTVYQLTGTSFAAVNGLNTAGKFVNFYSLRGNNLYMSIMDSTYMNGIFYYMQAENNPTVLNIDPTTSIPYADYSDKVSNYIIVGSTKLYWYNVKTDNTLNQGTITSTQVSLAGIKNVALAGNKAVLLFDTQIEYFQFTASGIEKITAKSYSNSDMLLADDGAWTIGLTCMCAALRKFACSSATLNCIIINKGVAACGSQQSDLTP